MTSRTLFIAVVILSACTVALNYALRRFEDGRTPANSRPTPRTVVSTSPAITEMLFELGLEESIVGVTEYCTFPPAAQQLPKIGDLVKPNLEQILTLKPDAVLLGNLVAWMQPEFERAGIATVQLHTLTVAQILDSIRRVGTVLGVEARAMQLVADLQSQIRRAKADLADRAKPKLMLVVGRSPGTLNDLYVVGSEVFLNDLLTFAGGRNIFEDLPLQYAKVSKEEIISRAPDIILESAHTIDLDTRSERAFKQIWRQLPSIPAVKRDRIYILNDDYLLVPGPRFVQTLEKFKAIIRPEL